MWRFLFKFFGTAIHNTRLLTLLLKIHKEEVSTQVRMGTAGGIRNHQELLKAWSIVVANFALNENYYQQNLSEIVMPLISNNITEAGTLRGKVTIWLEVLSVLKNQLSRFFGTVTYPFLEHLFNASHQDIALLKSTRVLILALVLSKNSVYQNKVTNLFSKISMLFILTLFKLGYGCDSLTETPDHDRGKFQGKVEQVRCLHR